MNDTRADAHIAFTYHLTWHYDPSSPGCPADIEEINASEADSATTENFEELDQIAANTAPSILDIETIFSVQANETTILDLGDVYD